MLKRLAKFTIWGWIGLNPVKAFATSMMMMGVGLIASGAFSPGVVFPQPSIQLPAANGFGNVNGGLTLPAGSMFLPSTPTASFMFYHDLGLPSTFPGGDDFVFGTANNGFRGIVFAGANSGTVTQSAALFASGSASTSHPWWLPTVGVSPAALSIGLAWSGDNGNNNFGFYNGVSTTGCNNGAGSRPVSVSVVNKTSSFAGSGFTNHVLATTDQGFLCSIDAATGAGPLITADNIPGMGISQATTGTTCANNTPSTGLYTVTSTMSVAAHGLWPGQSVAFTGFTPSGFNVTYGLVNGTAGSTLVGVAAGSCPAASPSVEGTIGDGAAGTITTPLPAINPWGIRSTSLMSGSGIQFKQNQRVCGAYGEFGSDSLFPGAQFAKYTDITGADLPGSPAISPWLNQNVGTFNGYIDMPTTQANGTPALHVTSMISTSISAASFSGGLVTFTAASTGYQIGSEFTVTGMTPSGYNHTYIAVTGTSGNTIVGNPLSGPVGVPSAITNPGTATGFGAMKSVITPGMVVMGATNRAYIAPYGQWQSTGVGDVGTYGLTFNPTTLTFTGAAASSGLSAITVSGLISTSQIVVVGNVINGTGLAANTRITGYGAATVGGNGTYTISPTTTGAVSGTITVSGIGSVTTPAPMYAASGFYFDAAPVASSSVGGVTAHTQAGIGDFINLIGTQANNVPVTIAGLPNFGGSVANVGMYQGPVKMTASGAPDATEWAKICGKSVDPTQWATTEGGVWNSLYKGNDGGVYADHGVAEFHGHMTGTTTLTIDSTEAGALPTVTASVPLITVSGNGLCTSGTCPTIVSGSGSSYVLSASATFSSEAMSAGNNAPATPITIQGPITGTISGNVLTVTQMAASGSLALGTNTFTGGATGASLAVTGGGSQAQTLTWPVASATGTTPLSGDCVSDGGVNIPVFAPACITGGGSPNYNLTPSGFAYRSSFTGETAYMTRSSINPGQWMTGANITTPVQVVAPISLTSSGCATTGFPGCGTYLLSNSANGTIGTPQTFTMTGLSSGGAIAPGMALAVKNPGWGVVYPTSGLGSLTGSIHLTGLYNASLGTPNHIQMLVASSPSLDATGQPVPVSGCSACAWTNVSSETIGAGAWSGTAVSIPNGGPYYVFIRAANATNYATLPNAVGVGWNLAYQGEGNSLDQLTSGGNSIGNNNLTYWQGMGTIVGWGTGGSGSNNSTNAGTFVVGPPVSNVWTESNVGQSQTESYSASGQAANTVGDGSGPLLANASAIAGGPVTLPNTTKNGTGFQQFFFDGVTQTQTVGLGDASAHVFSSGVGYGGTPSTSAGATTTTFSGSSITGTAMALVTGSCGSVTWSCIEAGDAVSCGSCTAGTIITAIPATLLTGGGGTGTYQVTPSQTVTSTSITITHNNLQFNGAWGYGAFLTGTVASNVLTVTALQAGVLAPLLNITDGTHTAQLTYCKTGCSLPGADQGGSTWQLSNTTLTGTIFTAQPTGGAPYPVSTTQPGQIPVDVRSAAVASTPLIQYGSLQILVNGSVVCQDTNTFAWNELSGNCTGAGVTGWVNYFTGAYAITFTTPPASGAPIVAKWTNLMTADNTLSHEQIHWLGTSDPLSGSIAAVAGKTGGFNALINGQQGTGGWPLNNLNYSRQQNWALGVNMSNLPNGILNPPMLCTGQWRGEGPIAFMGLFSYSSDYDLEQLCHDTPTKSEFVGTLAGSGGTTATLTLSASTSNEMWEGEVVECNPSAPFTCAIPQGAEIQGLCTAATCGTISPQPIGASGSTYNIVFPSSQSAFSFTGNMHNAMYYAGGGGYVGPYNDLVVQAGFSTQGNYSVETGGGGFGSLRYGQRIGIEVGAVLAGDPTKGTTPTINRTAGAPGGCASGSTISPCFDSGTTYAATGTGTVSTVTAHGVSVSQIVFGSGISAGQRPFVPGQNVTCAGCTARIITDISLPPTQSTVTGAGQVGQSLTVTLGGLLGVTGSKAITAGCSGTGGTNCLDFAFDLTTTGATALQTCGVNNLVGLNTNAANAAGYNFPNGVCIPTGIGAFVRGFRIGANQTMDTAVSNPTPLTSFPAPAGSVYDFGADPDSKALVINQNQAFTCNIVAAKVVQCVLGPTYSGGVFSSIGQWPTGSTYAAYGDPYATNSYLGGLIGYPGGQGFPFTAGTGYTSGHYVTGSTGCTLSTIVGANVSAVAMMGFDIVGGQIVNVYPQTMGNGIGSTCTWPISFSGTGTLTGSAGTNTTFKIVTLSGGVIGPGEVITISGQTVTIKPIVGALSNAGTSTSQSYGAMCATTCTNVASATAFTVGPAAGSGGVLGPVPLLWSTGSTVPEGVGGLATYDSDTNGMGTFIYDDSGRSGGPLDGKFALPGGGVGVPGLPARPFGMRRGVMVDSSGSAPAAAACAPDQNFMCAGGFQ